MTIIKDDGITWTEVHSIAMSIPDAAGVTNGNVTLDRPGDFLYGNVQMQNNQSGDNAQGIGAFSLTQTSNSSLTIGTNITGCRVKIIKIAGTEGAITINVNVLLIMRKSGA